MSISNFIEMNYRYDKKKYKDKLQELNSMKVKDDNYDTIFEFPFKLSLETLKQLPTYRIEIIDLNKWQTYFDANFMFLFYNKKLHEEFKSFWNSDPPEFFTENEKHCFYVRSHEILGFGCLVREVLMIKSRIQTAEDIKQYLIYKANFPPNMITILEPIKVTSDETHSMEIPTKQLKQEKFLSLELKQYDESSLQERLL